MPNDTIAYFRTSTGYAKAISSGSANDITQNGFYDVASTVTDLPTSNYYFLQVIAENNLWVVQRAFINVGGSTSIADVAGGYVRYRRNGTWTAWQKLATFEQGTWTAHIYDYETKLFEMPSQIYWKIGKISIAKIYSNPFPDTTFAEMLQIRNLPFGTVIGGNIYSGWAGGNLGDRTFQETEARVYVRPNFTGRIGGGVFSAMIIGFDF